MHTYLESTKMVFTGALIYYYQFFFHVYELGLGHEKVIKSDMLYGM